MRVHVSLTLGNEFAIPLRFIAQIKSFNGDKFIKESRLIIVRSFFMTAPSSERSRNPHQNNK